MNETWFPKPPAQYFCRPTPSFFFFFFFFFISMPRPCCRRVLCLTECAASREKRNTNYFKDVQKIYGVESVARFGFSTKESDIITADIPKNSVTRTHPPPPAPHPRPPSHETTFQQTKGRYTQNQNSLCNSYVPQKLSTRLAQKNAVKLFS